MKHEDITDKIIKAFYNVYNTLGYGFLEKVYEKAMQLELKALGLNVECQKRILVYYRSQIVGDYSADMIIEKMVICELKTAESFCEENEAQVINYLKATQIEVGLLLNFGKRPQVKRKIFDNDKKSLPNDFLSITSSRANPFDLCYPCSKNLQK